MGWRLQPEGCNALAGLRGLLSEEYHVFTAAIESDMHCGDVYGLVNPALVSEKYKEFARILFDWRAEKIVEVGPVDMLIQLGELTEGPGRKSTKELWTSDMEEQAIAAAEMLAMWPCNDYRLCYASEYHSGTESKTENMVVDKLKLNHNRKADIKSTQRLEILGVKIHARHYVGSSSTPHGKQSQLAKAATTDILRGVYRDYPGADIYLRAHTHEYAVAGNDLYTAYNNPCLKWPLGEFGQKIDRAWYTMGLQVLRVRARDDWDMQQYLLRVRLPEEVYATVA